MAETDLSVLQITQDKSVLDAIQAITEGARQIAFVVDNERRLIGAVTDGDIRRGLLNKVQLTDSVELIMNPSPFKVLEDQSREEIIRIMRQHSVHQIPVVDIDDHILRIEWIDDLISPTTHKDTWVVLMAGGLGTRLRPLTEDTPKPMLRIGGKPLLERIIQNFIEQGFSRFFLSVNFKAEKVQDYFGDGSQFGAKIQYLREDKRLGTAGALSLLPQLPSEPMIVMNGDLITSVNFQHLLSFHKEQRTSATMCAREYTFQVPYGVIETDGAKLLRIVEKPIHSFLVNSGIYVVSPEVLKLIPHNEYFDMPQLFNTLLKHQQSTSVFPLHEYWLDIGQLDDLEKAKGEYQKVFGK